MTLVSRMTLLANRLTDIPVRFGVPQFKELTVRYYTLGNKNDVTLSPHMEVTDVKLPQIVDFVGYSEVSVVSDYKNVRVPGNIPKDTFNRTSFDRILIEGQAYMPIGYRENELTHYDMVIRRLYD